jgi:hypothetical protein
LSERLSKKIGIRNSTSFWCEVWVGTASFASLFPRLFFVSSNPAAIIIEMGGWINSWWIWNLSW